ncbi:hypothetical protein L249_3631 [Ophiocordyceps polyrhachis-furcata BCC 54312]|uniref:Uncharacterized protein n=1 Tax=Ophiocordyceps polyrhachis-furcata BCC 54312 TaxID=1330021 RepID=A0A367LLZ1_9HYPO|nr:hypothetical protein L249_3631 [Ophiocordyceps polyrhachis-furcata BCC 54312]
MWCICVLNLLCQIRIREGRGLLAVHDKDRMKDDPATHHIAIKQCVCDIRKKSKKYQQIEQAFVVPRIRLRLRRRKARWNKIALLVWSLFPQGGKRLVAASWPELVMRILTYLMTMMTMMTMRISFNRIEKLTSEGNCPQLLVPASRVADCSRLLAESSNFKAASAINFLLPHRGCVSVS